VIFLIRIARVPYRGRKCRNDAAYSYRPWRLYGIGCIAQQCSKFQVAVKVVIRH
jgi:hypothetical protein